MMGRSMAPRINTLKRTISIRLPTNPVRPVVQRSPPAHHQPPDDDGDDDGGDGHTKRAGVRLFRHKLEKVHCSIKETASTLALT